MYFKKRFYILLCLAILSVVFVCSSCGQNNNDYINQEQLTKYEEITDNNASEEILPLEYVQEYVRIDELCVSGWLINKSLYMTTYRGNQYYFDNSINEVMRNSFVINQEKICDFLNDNGINAQNIKFYVVRGIDNHAISSDNAVYIDILQADNYTQVALTLEAVLGEYTNYGYIFALSNYICDKLSWQHDTNAQIDIEVLKNNPYLLNLNYPSFSKDYVDENELSSVKNLAVKILGQMQNAFAGESEFQKLVDKYANDNSLDYHKTYLSFAYGGKNCPLKIKTKYLDIYLDSDYQGSCILTEQSILDDPMFNFQNLIDFWEYVDSDLAEVRNQFGFNDSNIISVYVQELNIGIAQNGEAGGYFHVTVDGPQILMEDIYTITHEYTHYIDFSMDKNLNDDIDWCSEVLACYYGKNMSYVERVVRAISGDPNVWTIEQLSKLVGSKYDNVEDEIMFMNIMNAYEERHKYALMTLYNGRLSFGYYFVETYGEQAFIDCMLTPSKCESLVGVDIYSVVDDWCVWLEQFKILD